ncbi:MAG: sensor histidine kinase [Mastigocoleus sp.]
MLRIKHQYDNLQNLLQLREDMVNMVVHDLRNPLTSIFLGLENLSNIEHPREKQKHKLARMYSSAQTLQLLIDDLLTMARLESGKVSPNCTEADIAELIHSVVSNFKAIAAQKNQVLGIQIPQESHKTVYVDVTMIHRVLDNLVSNAIKFSPEDSQIIVRVEFLPSNSCKIQVIDCGSGVPDELQHKIFEKYQIGTSIPDVTQIGLGLAFCKMVVEAHQGEICIKNNHSQGATFEITLATSK